MQNKTITIECTDVISTQEWTSDPAMIAITLDLDFLRKAQECVTSMKAHGVDIMTIWWAFGYQLYAVFDKDDDSEFIVGDDGIEYREFEPEYRLDGCHAQIFADGQIRALMPFKQTSDKVFVDVGKVDDLLSRFAGTDPATVPTDTSYDIPNLCQRLLKMQTVDQEVIKDAVKALERLKSGLKATQTTLSTTMQHVEAANKFVGQVAGLSIWGHDQDDGTPYEECDDPSDGTVDSHECLMNLIEEARRLEGESKQHA